MALIKCPECGNQVSVKATACPHCGCPTGNVETAQEQMYEEETQKKKWWIWALVVSMLFLIGGWAYYGYTHQPQEEAKELVIEEHKDGVETGMTDNIVEFTPEFINAIKKYEDLGEFSDGYAAVSKGHKWGYINTKGDVAIPVTIDADCVGKFSEGLAIVIPNSSEDFYVIDPKGKTVFKGKNLLGVWDILCIPYYIDGKMYVPTDDNGYKYRIYDKQGNITGTVDSEVGDNFYKNHQIGDYTIFSMTHDRYDEVDSYQRDETFGLKDISGKIVISADYDDIQGQREGTIKISNGVVLVALTEYDEDYDGGEDEHTRYHYGYADLKGNDTFTAEQKRRWRQSKIDAMKKFDEESIETNEYDNTSTYNTERTVTIYVKGTFAPQGGHITCESNYSTRQNNSSRLIIGPIVVPNGKVWIYKDHSFSSDSNIRYKAGFCDDSGWRYILANSENDHYGQGWRDISEMNGERYFGGKNFYMFWNHLYATPGGQSFYFEANFLEKNDN